MPIKFDVDLVDAHIVTLGRHTSALAALHESTNRLARFGVQPWCDQVSSKIDEILAVTTSTVEVFDALKTQILAADHLGPAIEGALGQATETALVALVRSVFESQAEDLHPDDLLDWAQAHPQWLPDLIDVLPYTDVDEAAQTARALDPVSLVEWWRNAPSSLRDGLLEAFPEVIGLLLRGGATFDDSELDLLRGAVAFSASTTSKSIGLEVMIPTTKIDLGLDGELKLAIETLSDGTALVHVISDASLSGVVAATSASESDWVDSATASLAVGLGAGGTLTFGFDDVDAAKAAIKRVADAVTSAATGALGHLMPGWARVVERSNSTLDRDAIGAVADVLAEFGQRLDNVQTEISADAIASFGTSVAGLAVAGDLGLEATGLRSEQIDGDHDDYVAARVELSASAEAELERPWFLPGDGTLIEGAAAGSAAAEIRRYDDGREVIVFDTAYSVRMDRSSPTATVHHATVTVPINTDTRNIVEDALRDVGNGKNPIDALAALDHHATIELRSATVRDQESKSGLLGNNFVQREHSSLTDSIRRRTPDGEWYSPVEIQAQIDGYATVDRSSLRRSGSST